MAVKPITNPHPKQKVNRGKELSTSGIQHRDVGNSRQSVIAKNFSKNFAITLKDVDETMMNHVKNIMNIHLEEAGERIKIPVYYGNEERWTNIKNHGALRDKNGSIILPVIVFKRSNVEFNDQMPMSHDQDVTGEFIKVQRMKRWSKENRYDRFSSQNNISPAYESLVTGMPDWINATYDFAVMTNYTEQMNTIIENFISHENTYFGDSLSYKFLSELGGGFSSETELEVGGERIIKMTFSWILKGYVIPETSRKLPNGSTFEASRQLSPNRVVFGSEGDATEQQIKK